MMKTSYSTIDKTFQPGLQGRWHHPELAKPFYVSVGKTLRQEQKSGVLGPNNEFSEGSGASAYRAETASTAFVINDSVHKARYSPRGGQISQIVSPN